MSHAGMSELERQALAIDWFADYESPRGPSTRVPGDRDNSGVTHELLFSLVQSPVPIPADLWP